jgi:hypothetical protein
MTLTDLSSSEQVNGLSVGGALVRRLRGEYRVDEWGLDDDLVQMLFPLSRLRWSIHTVGAPHLPLDGPAVLVYNRRVGVSERSILATAVFRATARVVRHPGVPDRAPVGPLLRRLGGVLRRPDEVAGLLRAGRLVGVPLGREVLSRHAAGPAPADLLEPALSTGAPVIPVALVGFEAGWRWRVAVGPPLSTSGGSHAPLAAAELAEQSRDAVQNLLDDNVSPVWPFS